jgi:hypothetical protein
MEARFHNDKFSDHFVHEDVGRRREESEYVQDGDNNFDVFNLIEGSARRVFKHIRVRPKAHVIQQFLADFNLEVIRQ